MSIDLALPETERKLREARFFLNYMRAEERKSIRPEPEAHGFYLSAFLSAGRSVTFVLQKEIGGEDHYRPWFDRWMSSRSEEERRLLKFINDQRVAEVHMVGSDTTQETAWVPMHLVDIGVRRHPAHSSSWFAPPGTPAPTMGVVTHSFTEGGESVVVACERYLALLNQLMSDIRRDFVGGE